MRISDWSSDVCSSDLLWWGHQIPAWYDAEGNVYVSADEAGAKALADNKPLTRDNDVLDTWFSSALWPFGTLGWPDETQTLKRHYPNDLLISGFDILFFWHASMVIPGLEFLMIGNASLRARG